VDIALPTPLPALFSRFSTGVAGGREVARGLLGA
jgi:hypothetical protein